ncbi:MAG: hypothetical protein HY289_06985 [Planctomycetes bacterium]|nr:hypothetical protein [Planctomycetota bacterium]
MSYDNRDTGVRADEKVVLELVKTRLRVRNRELQRLNAQGGIILSVPLAELKSIEARPVVDPIAIAFIVVGAALGAVTHFFWDDIYVWARWLLGVVAVLLAGFACFGIMQRKIVIQTLDGEISFYCNDPPDEGCCFVLSVRQLLRTLQQSRDAEQGPETGFRA